MSIKVIGAGLGRTGTLSLKNALEELGFAKCYHMVEILKKPDYGKYWIAVSKGENVNWDEVFEGYQSTVDFPSCIHYKEQMAFYPDAKVVLTVRDPEKWYESTYSTIYKAGPSITQMITMPFLLPFSPRRRKLISWFKYIDSIWKVMYQGKFEDRAFAIAKFNEWNEEVKRIVPPEKLLVFDVKEGWGPLCKFLGVPIPEGKPFPRVNDRESFNKNSGKVMSGKMD